MSQIRFWGLWHCEYLKKNASKLSMGITEQSVTEMPELLRTCQWNAKSLAHCERDTYMWIALTAAKRVKSITPSDEHQTLPISTCNSTAQLAISMVCTQTSAIKRWIQRRHHGLLSLMAAAGRFTPVVSRVRRQSHTHRRFTHFLLVTNNAGWPTTIPIIDNTTIIILSTNYERISTLMTSIIGQNKIFQEKKSGQDNYAVLPSLEAPSNPIWQQQKTTTTTTQWLQTSKTL